MEKTQRGNLYTDLVAPEHGERFETLAALGGGKARVELIVSSAAPEPGVYDQVQDEWVVLLAGSAELEVAGERVLLSAGDYVLLPARTVHRVVAASHGARWLAVHVDR